MSLTSLLNKAVVINEQDEAAKFAQGEITLKQMQDEYELYSKANHDALKNLYEEHNGFKPTQENLFNIVLPQLKLLNELSTLVHAFPHYSIPSVMALTNDLKEKVNYTLNNIQNFGQVGSIITSDPELAGMVSKQRPPYKYVAGNDDESSDDEAGKEEAEPEEEPEEEPEDDGIIVDESSTDSDDDEQKKEKKKKLEKNARPVSDSSKSRKRVKKVKKVKKTTKKSSGSI